jgi:DNA replicative helicase MCM subunit Mcm2 (Cdc46/Mcm family)
MTDEPTPDDIDDALEQFENQPWGVVDWHHESGRFEEATLEIELEWSPIKSVDAEVLQEATKTVKTIIDDHAPVHDEGVPTEVVKQEMVDMAESDEMDKAAVAEIIEDLKQKGEVYEPRTDHLRRT